MDVERYFEHVKVLYDKVQDKKDEYEVLKMSASCPGGIVYDRDQIVTSTLGDRLENIVIRCEELKNEIFDLHKRYLDAVYTSEMMISELTGRENLQCILKLHYLKFMSYTKIAKFLAVKRKTAIRWKNEGIAILQDTYK